MTVRLTFVAHAATSGQRQVVFGDSSSLLHPELVPPWVGRVASWTNGPEPACTQTVERLGGLPHPEPRLAGLDAGRWAGRTLTEVAEAEPDAVATWLADVAAAPHGGESLAALVGRVGRYLDEQVWPSGRTIAVVTPLVARAAAVHALGAAAQALFRVDVGPLGRVQLVGGPGMWRLTRLG